MSKPIVYAVGPDGFTDYEEEKIIAGNSYRWIVYWYESGCYDGTGMAFALREDGMVDAGMLGHCSCYGPLDDWPDNTQDMHETLREMIFDSERPGGEKRRMPEDYDYAMWQAIGVKIRELLDSKRRGTV